MGVQTYEPLIKEFVRRRTSTEGAEAHCKILESGEIKAGAHNKIKIIIQL